MSTSPLPAGRGRGRRSDSLQPKVGRRTSSTSIAPGVIGTESALPIAKEVPKIQEARMPPLEVYHGNSSQENSPDQLQSNGKRKIVPIHDQQQEQQQQRVKETEKCELLIDVIGHGMLI